MLRYCAWCDKYQGATTARGYQIREHICEIDTATICPSCLTQFLKELPREEAAQP